ncbi:hypothetical protein JCM8097_006215 [Rhodosporidiobolus ruineniae]
MASSSSSSSASRKRTSSHLSSTSHTRLSPSAGQHSDTLPLLYPPSPSPLALKLPSFPLTGDDLSFSSPDHAEQLLPVFPLPPLGMDSPSTTTAGELFHLAQQQQQQPTPAHSTSYTASPPMVPLEALGGYGHAQQYPSTPSPSAAHPQSHTATPLSPTSAFGTPALSLSSSSVHLTGTPSTVFDELATPATTASGLGGYGSPAAYGQGAESPAMMAGGAFYGAEGAGLGLTQDDGAFSVAPGLPGAGGAQGGKGKAPAPALASAATSAAALAAASAAARSRPDAGGAPPGAGHRRTTSTTRPPEVARKGEEMGLSLGDFDMLDTLGTGTFGRVLLARLRPDPHKRPQQTQPYYFAMKVLEKNTVVRLRQVEHVNSERTTLAWVQHPFVVNLFCTFQDESNLYLLLEYVQGGELFSHLRRAGRFSADVARFYAANLVLALEHLHKADIIYRDLKPENLLIDHTGHIKMTDFGFAKYVPERTYTLCGTPEYLAPEIITATGHSSACDWWALGVLLFELLAGYPPFFADNPLEIYEKILQGRFGVPAHVDPLAKDLIRRLLTADLSKRLGNLKGGAQDVKNHPWFEGVDWAAVERKEIRAPIIPHTSIPGDCSNFERFPQTSIEAMPGVLRALSKRKYGFEPERGEDAYGYLFPNF